jgi:hypothetical protein
VPSADRLERLTNQLVNIAEADMVAAIETTEGAYGTSRMIVVSFAVGSILLALGLGYIISWSLIEPVKPSGSAAPTRAASCSRWMAYSVMSRPMAIPPVSVPMWTPTRMRRLRPAEAPPWDA